MAPAAPSTHNQPSRKSKSSWRKNIDLTPVTTGLDAARTERIQTGDLGLLADQPEEALFQTDTAGDVGVKRKSEKEHGRLRVDEILAERSRVPAVAGRKRGAVSSNNGEQRKKSKSGAGLSKKEYERLRQVAYGGAAASVLDANGNLEANENANGGRVIEVQDPWAVSAAPAQTTNSEWVQPKPPPKAPSTIYEPPKPLTESGRLPQHIPKPHPHTSYNPSAPDWISALTTAGEAEVAAERKRQDAALKEEEREARVAKAGEVKENGPEAISDAEGLSEYESEWEGIVSASEAEMSERDLAKKRPQRKSIVERNRVKRRKQREAAERHEARMRLAKERAGIARENAERDGKVVAKVDSALATSDSDAASEDDEDGLKLAKRRFGQKQIPEKPLELVLPDELEDSLRRLKPEGNLLNDRFRSMIVQGKVEARPRPVGQMRKKRVKATEKWGYKDWRLD